MTDWASSDIPPGLFMQILNKLRNPFKTKLSLAVIFVEYDRSKGKSDNIFKSLQGYLANIEGCQITYLRVDNANEEGTITQDGNIYLISGDNTFREFSGWQRGIEALNSLNIHCDIVLITNEMFLKPGPSFLQDYSTMETLENCRTNDRVIGRIDTAHQHYTVFGYDVSSWICTNAFFVPKLALDRLNSVILLNNNIHKILTKDYNDKHLQHQAYLTPTTPEHNIFTLEIDLPNNSQKELRFLLEEISPEGEITANDNKLQIVINEIFYNENSCPNNVFIRGIAINKGKRQTSASFLLSLPKEPGRLIIKGFMPPEFRDKLGRNLLRISVYNDSYLFQENAPINTTYQRWIVEWLSERWHSKFTINADTWELFKTKASAIINESLLTAKLSELGYNPVSYGDKKYY